MPDLTTRTEPPGAVVITPGTIAPGRARGVAPLRREGPDKLTGAAKYADDLVFPGAWFGATIRSTDAHARFDALDLDPAFDWSKVVVVTAADIPGDNVVSSIKEDQPILVPLGGEIQHHAEPLALLAAPDRETLRAARRAAHARTSPLPAVFDPEASDHVFAAYELAAGDPEAAFAAADLILEGEYRVGHQEQLYIENNAMIAVPSDDGGVTVHGSLQCPYYVHAALRRGLAMDDTQARVVQAETGGGFGGKEEYPSVIGLHAALLALKAGPPRPDDLRPSRGHRGDDEAAPGDRPPPDRRDPRRPADRPGHRGRHGRRGVLHADPGRPVAWRDPCRWAVSLPERAHLGPRDADEHATERSLPRVRRAAGPVRGRDPSQPAGRDARDQPARDPSAQRLPRRRHDADRPGPARQRGRRGGPRARRRGGRVRTPARPPRRGSRPAQRLRDDPRVAPPDGSRADGDRASGWRSPGTAPGSPAPARSSSRPWSRSS